MILGDCTWAPPVRSTLRKWRFTRGEMYSTFKREVHKKNQFPCSKIITRSRCVLAHLLMRPTRILLFR